MFMRQNQFLMSKAMVVGSLVILLIGLGNFIPSLWIPSELCLALTGTWLMVVAFANDMDMTKPGGTGLIALMNGTSVTVSAVARQC